jgi:hypothetical protein
MWIYIDFDIMAILLRKGDKIEYWDKLCIYFISKF